MTFIAWLILGLIAGFIGSKLVNQTGEGLVLDIILGIVGAIVGGFVFSFFGASGVNWLNLHALPFAESTRWESMRPYAGGCHRLVIVHDSRGEYPV